MSNLAASPATWFDRSSRVRVEITGPDRAKFLHNLTTNDVKRLAEGSGHEAFITSPQGKTLAYVTLLATEESILLRSDPGAADSFLPHLAKYGVFDDVTLLDISPATFEYHVAGPQADAMVAALGVDLASAGKMLQHREVELLGRKVRLIHESLIGEPGWSWVGPLDLASAVRLECFANVGATQGDEATFDALRIEAGTPLSGRDVLTNNLPQEVGRDNRAINFVKGCYLGQETVARLDALGHVNRILRRGHIEGTTEVPPPGTALVGDDGKPAGSITSAAHRPDRGVVFLAYVRVSHAAGGTRLAVPSLSVSAGGAAVAVVADPTAPG